MKNAGENTCNATPLGFPTSDVSTCLRGETSYKKCLGTAWKIIHIRRHRGEMREKGVCLPRLVPPGALPEEDVAPMAAPLAGCAYGASMSGLGWDMLSPPVSLCWLCADQICLSATHSRKSIGGRKTALRTKNKLWYNKYAKKNGIRNTMGCFPVEESRQSEKVWGQNVPLSPVAHISVAAC